MGGEHPDWLPRDWKVIVKIRSYGRKDKYYFHPRNGLTFNSKPEVLRYLKSSGKTSKKKEINKINIKKTVADKLPQGWIKEIRIKKSGGKTRRDPYYTDPVSGRQFRSMQEVFRYLKSKDSGETESKSDDKGCSSMEAVDHSQSLSAEAKGRRSIDKKGDKNMTDGKSGPDAAPLKKVEKPLLEEKKLLNKLQEKDGKERQIGGRRMSPRLAGCKLKHESIDNGLRSGSKVAAENKMNIPSETKSVEEIEKGNRCTEESQKHEDVVHQYKRRNMKRKWMNDLPRRTSKRLAHLEADQPVDEVKTSKRDGASARLSSKEEGDSIKNAAKSEKSDEPEINTSDIIENPTNNEQKESIEHKELSPEEAKRGEQKEEKEEKHLVSSLKDLFMDPCIEFAIKTLTGAIPIEDVSKVDANPVSSLASSKQTLDSGNIWSDPCFEFAVKTLTGEMPSENDLQFQISGKKPGNPSGSQKV